MADGRDFEELARITAEINAAWLDGDIERARDHFHPAVVVVAPGGAHRIDGRDGCLQSYREFTMHAVVHEFTAEAPQIDRFGETAIVLTPFRIHYEMKGVKSTEQGRDVFVFTRTGSRWIAVWRTMFAETGETPAPPA